MAGTGAFRASPWQQWLDAVLPGGPAVEGTADVSLPVPVDQATSATEQVRLSHPLGRTRLAADPNHGRVLRVLPAPPTTPGPGDLRLQVSEAGAGRSLVRIVAPAALCDPVTLRALQHAVVAAATGATAGPGDLTAMLRYAQWQHRLPADAGPGRTDTATVLLPIERSIHRGDQADQLVTQTAGPDVTAALAEVTARLSVPAESVLLGCWWLLLRASAGGQSPQLWVAGDDRVAPVPTDAHGLLLAYQPWPPARPEDAPTAAEAIRTAARLLAEPSRPAWPSADAPTALPSFGYLAVPGHTVVTTASGTAELHAPVPAGLARTLMFSPAVGERTDLRLRFAAGRIDRTDAESLLTEIGRQVAALPERLTGPWRPYAPVAHPAEVTTAPDPEPFWTRIERHAARRPDAPAVCLDAETLTYGELVRAVHALAARLRAHGVGPDRCVGVLVPDSPQQVVALLAVHVAGGAYVPLHHELPAERVAAMLRVAGAELVLRAGPALPLPDGVRELPLDEAESNADADVDADAVDGVGPGPADLHPDHLAYVMFTSGSTGTPKGVMISRRGLDNYLDWAVRTYPYQAGAGVVSHTAPIFDLSVTALIAPLCAGQRVQIAPSQAGIDGLLDAARRVGDVSLLKLTPAHLALLARLDLPRYARVRAVVVGGEDLPADVVDQWRTVLPDCAVHNEYGPTETVVGCTLWTVGSTPTGYPSVPIGRPIASTSVLVCDDELTAVPPGVPGELCVGGVGVARGYAGDPRRTAERFVPDPAGAPGARMYRTGDRAVATAAAGLLFQGRLDRQLKLHGFRIEPAEVELRLRQLPGVSDALVRVATGPGGDPALIGYLVATAELDLSGVRDRLAGTLPWYLVPSALIPIPALPLAANGKVDPDRLPSLATATAGDGPLTPMQRVVRQVWAEVLGIGQPDLDARFFELGGTSYSLVKVNARLREELSRDIAISDMFERPTIRQLAEFLDAAAPSAAASAADAAHNQADQAHRDDQADLADQAHRDDQVDEEADGPDRRAALRRMRARREGR